METINTIGRRKNAVARVYITKGKGQVIVNKRSAKDYFPTPLMQNKIASPFRITETDGKYNVKAVVRGGGATGQVEALRMAIARALVQINPEFRAALKAEGLMKRDPRMVERKKFGQPKARKKFQFSKR